MSRLRELERGPLGIAPTSVFHITKGLRLKKPHSLVVMASLAAAIAGSFAVRAFFDRPSSLDAALVEASDMMNRGLPMMVDSATRLDTTFPGPGKTLNYKYTLVGTKLADLDVAEVKSELATLLAEGYKTSPEMRNLRRNSVVLRYHYYDEDGAFAFVIDVDPDDAR